MIISKLFDGKDKLFFMLSLGEHTSTHTLGASATTVPTAAERQGNFAGLLNSSGAAITIYDPNTAVLNGTNYTRTAFSGNQIPSGRINMMGQTLINLYPLPNQTGIGPAGTNNYEGIVPNSGSNTQWLGRLDFVLSQRNRMYASFGQTDSVTVSPGTFIGVLANGTSIPGDNNASHGVIDWTTVVSPTTTLDLRVGYGRDFSYRDNAAAQGYNPTTLGFPASLVSQFYGLWFPNFSFSEYGTFGPSNSMNATGTDNVVSVHADLGKIIGTHYLRMGAQFNQYGTASISPGFADGSYAFSPQYTQQNPLAASSTSGNDAADLLLGIPTSGTVALNANPYYENRLWGLYFQDDWKATKRMALNLGLRWDYDTPLYERYNRLVDGFAFSTPSPLAAAVATAPGVANCPACLHLLGGLTYASGSSPYAWQPDYRGIQPRLGVAYQLDKHTVFRGGFGMYTLQQAGNQTGSLTEGFSNSTAMQTSLDGGITVTNYVNNPFPNGLIKPVGSTLGLSTLLGTGVYFPTQQAPNSYSYMWSIGLQRELPRQYVIEASYVANKTTGFPLSLGTDSIPNADLGQAQSYYTTKVTNPMAGLLPNNATLNGATISQQYLLTPYPEFNGPTGGNIPIGWNRYDSLQISLKHRFGNGSSLMVNYDNSKNLMRMSALNGGDYNPTNPNLSLLEERLGTFDVPQKVNFLGTFILPVGRGQHFGNSMPKVLDKVVGGWKLGWVWTIQSGFPVAYPNNAAVLPGTAEIPPSQRTYYHWFNTSLFPKTAFPANTYRTFPSEFPDVRYMGEKDAEISLMKEFPIYERLKFRVRADFTNAFNHPFFTTMQSTDVTNAQFGQLNVAGGQNNSPRGILMQGNIIF